MGHQCDGTTAIQNWCARYNSGGAGHRKINLAAANLGALIRFLSHTLCVLHTWAALWRPPSKPLTIPGYFHLSRERFLSLARLV